MKNALTKIWKNKFAVVIILMLAFLLPEAMTLPAQMLSKSVFVALGIDKLSDGQYEVSGCLVVNEFMQTGKTNLAIRSEKASSVYGAIQNLGFAEGRETGLKHCTLLVMGSSLKDEELLPLFDYFIRSGEMSNNSFLTWTDGSAKTLLDTAIKEEKNNGYLIQTIADFNQENVYQGEANIEKFFADSLAFSKTSFMGTINYKEKEQQSTSSSGTDSSGSSGSSDTSGSEQTSEPVPEYTIENTASGVVFVDGKYGFELTKEQIINLNFINPKLTKQKLTLENVTGENLKDATIVLDILEKSAKFDYSFKDDVPEVALDIKLFLKIEEISDSENIRQYLQLKDQTGFNTIKQSVTKQISDGLNDVLQTAKTNNADFLNFEEGFYKRKNKEYKKLKEKMQDNFFQQTELKINIEVNLIV